MTSPSKSDRAFAAKVGFVKKAKVFSPVKPLTPDFAAIELPKIGLGMVRARKGKKL